MSFPKVLGRFIAIHSSYRNLGRAAEATCAMYSPRVALIHNDRTLINHENFFVGGYELALSAILAESFKQLRGRVFDTRETQWPLISDNEPQFPREWKPYSLVERYFSEQFLL